MRNDVAQVLRREARVNLEAARELGLPLPAHSPLWSERLWAALCACGRTIKRWEAEEERTMPGETERHETNSRIWRAEQALKTAKRFRTYDAVDVAAILRETARLLGVKEGA